MQKTSRCPETTVKCNKMAVGIKPASKIIHCVDTEASYLHYIITLAPLMTNSYSFPLSLKEIKRASCFARVLLTVFHSACLLH